MSDLYRLNPAWVKYSNSRTEANAAEWINNEYGVHAEGLDSLVPLIPVEIDYEAAVDAANDGYDVEDVVNAATGVSKR